MKQCLTCSNQVPDGRVIAKCDGCLALIYYGDALDNIINLLQWETGDTDLKFRDRAMKVQEIAQDALKTVPRPAPFIRSEQPFDMTLLFYAVERRKHLSEASDDCGAKHALSADLLDRSRFGDRDYGAISRAKIDFGTYRWAQGRLAEIDDLIRWIEQRERK